MKSLFNDSVVIERIWMTMAGYTAAALIINRHHRTGYVAVPKTHPYHGRSTEDGDVAQLAVHGGITFSGDDLTGVMNIPRDWWLGFDCAHCSDVPIPQESVTRGRAKTLEFIIYQCESLANQLASINAKYRATQAGGETP